MVDQGARRQFLYASYRMEAQAAKAAALAQWWAQRPPYVAKPDDLAALMKKLPPNPDWNAPPLIKAILDKKPDVVRVLIAEGANVNSVEEHDYGMYGNTPLAIAENVKNEEIIAILKEAGAKHIPVAEQEGGRRRRGRSRRGRRNRRRTHRR